MHITHMLDQLVFSPEAIGAFTMAARDITIELRRFLSVYRIDVSNQVGFATESLALACTRFVEAVEECTVIRCQHLIVSNQALRTTYPVDEPSPASVC